MLIKQFLQAPDYEKDAHTVPHSNSSIIMSTMSLSTLVMTNP